MCIRDRFYADVDLQFVDGIGHFVPLEAPDRVAEAIRARLA